MDGLNYITAWISGNETLLSGVAAIVVVLSIVVSPLGAGLRGLVRRKALSSVGFVEGSAAATPNNSDIPQAFEPEADRPSIAVLPFVPVSDDKDSEIFADGMTNDIITALGHVPGFFVTSGNSTFVYKGQSVDTRKIGRELGVRYVVEGRVQRAGNNIRINATLVEAATGDQIWSEQFTGDLSNIFALQDEVTQSIVGQLQPELAQAEGRRGTRLPTEDMDAWTLLHSARMKFRVGHGRDAVEEAERLGLAALGKDPDYAEAHAFLIEVVSHQVAVRWSDDPERDAQRCVEYCRTALELEPDNPNVLYGAAIQSLFTGNTPVAARQIERCCEINPNDAFAQGVRGIILAVVERGEEGLDAVELAFRLSPHDPRTYYLLWMRGWVFSTLARYAEAEQSYRLALDLHDGFVWIWFSYPVVLAMHGKAEEAKSAVAELQRLCPDLGFEDWKGTYKLVHGNIIGERKALVDRQIDSMREVWPS